MLSIIKIMVKRILFAYKYRKAQVVCDSNFVSLNAEIGSCSTFRQGTEVDNYCTIGNYVYFGKGCSVTKSTVGHYCSIANYVSIGQGEHDFNKVSTSSLFYEEPYQQLTLNECIIGNDVWIGVGATVRRGVVVGNGAVIGAHAVVTKDVPPFAVVAGVPAKILKYRFTDQKIEDIESSQWWDSDIIEAKNIIDRIEAEGYV